MLCIVFMEQTIKKNMFDFVQLQGYIFRYASQPQLNNKMLSQVIHAIYISYEDDNIAEK